MINADDARNELHTILELTDAGPDTYRAAPVAQPSGRIYGGQVLAQALLAAARTVEADRLPHSIHGYFLRPGKLDEPITLSVDRLRDGRSFSARRSHAIQSGGPILSMITSFQVPQDGLEHQASLPEGVPDPDDLVSSLDLLNEDVAPVARAWVHRSAFELRHYPRQIYTGPGPAVTDLQYVWMRCRLPVPDDELTHRALLAYACDQILFEPAMRRHHLSWTTQPMALASLDHAMWWHRPVRVDDWVLFAQRSPSAQGGRALSVAQVYTRDGVLVADIAQEGMLRVPPGEPERTPPVAPL